MIFLASKTALAKTTDVNTVLLTLKQACNIKLRLMSNPGVKHPEMLIREVVIRD